MATQKPGESKVFLVTFFSKKVTPYFPTRAGWRQALRMTLAALLAYFSTDLIGLHHGYWAVITTLIIVQGSLGATIAAGISRMAGTAAGAVMGGLGVLLLRLDTTVPEWLVLLIVIIPLALMASRPLFKLAPLSGALVLLLAGTGDMAFALSRVTEIGFGTVIGVLVALVVLPERATAILIEHCAAILEQLGAFAENVLAIGETPARDAITTKIGAAFAQIHGDLTEVQNERGARLLRSDPFPERLTRHLQRLRTDVSIVGRAMSLTPGQKPYPDLAAAIRSQFDSRASALRRRAPVTPSAPAMLDVPAESPLGFALATLQRELVELDDILNQWSASRHHGLIEPATLPTTPPT